jgi:hypothetical protein
MAQRAPDEPIAVTVEAVATKVVDRWVIRVAVEPHVSVRVRSLEDVDAAVTHSLRRGTETRVHIYWYH